MSKSLVKFFIFLFTILFCTSAFALPTNWPKDSVIVQPDMKRDPLMRAFKDAKYSLTISAYKLLDNQLIAELAEAVKRGVKVDVLVTKEIFKRKGETKESETPIEKLKELGMNVHQSPDFYAQTHHKMIIVDDAYALIGTGNMAPGSFDESKDRKAERDFWITVIDKDYLKELKDVFKADFNGKKTDLRKALLVWSPDQGRAPFIKLIHSAKSSIWVYQQDIEDKEIADALVNAARKGIEIRLLMTPYPFSKTKDGNIPNQEMIRGAGGKVGLITHVITHAKVVLIDVGTKSAKAYVGSANFYAPSLDNNRELGVVTANLQAIHRIRSVFEADWKQADFNARPPGLQ